MSELNTKSLRDFTANKKIKFGVMPYDSPKKVKGGWILPKKGGGYHRSGKGKVVKFSSAAGARTAGNYILALEHGFKPTGKGKKRGK
jgi:hypothetical protein